MGMKTKSFKLPLSIERVTDILVNLDEYGFFHPLIERCKLVEGSNSLYQVSEQPFLWLPFKISYSASVLKNDHEITYQLSGIPLHKVDITFCLSELDHQTTLVDVVINVKGPIIIANYLQYKIGIAQTETFANITSF
jgi:hypothetical protein